MELAELLTELLVELKAWAKIRQLEAQVEIWQLKELEVFDGLRLSVVVLAEVLVELASETELARTELTRTELVRTELARTELMQTELVARVKIR